MQQWALCEETHSWVSLSQTKDSDFVNLGRAQESVLRDSGNETQVTFQNYWLWSSSWLWLLLDFLKKEILFFFQLYYRDLLFYHPLMWAYCGKIRKPKEWELLRRWGWRGGRGAQRGSMCPSSPRLWIPSQQLNNNVLGQV